MEIYLQQGHLMV